jgi:hypothetical protein
MPPRTSSSPRGGRCAPLRRLPAIAPLLLAIAGCAPNLYRPEQATRPYPDALHLVTVETPEEVAIKRPRGVDIQVFRGPRHIVIVNSTARSYRDFDLWINQRFVRHVEALPAGKTIRLPLDGFFDERGEAITPGGFWRTREPTPIRLVEIQLDEEQPLIGLVTVVEDEAG